MDQNYRSEYAESWTLSLQRVIRKDWVVEASYFGSKIVGADDTTFYNIPRPGPGPIAARRPNPNLSALQIIHWGGYSNYHALNLKLEKRLSNRLRRECELHVVEGDRCGIEPRPDVLRDNFPQDVRYREAEEALSSFDHRHRLALSFNYELARRHLDPGLRHVPDRRAVYGEHSLGQRQHRRWSGAAARRAARIPTSTTRRPNGGSIPRPS